MTDDGLSQLRVLMRRLLVGTTSGSIAWQLQDDFTFAYVRPDAAVLVGADTDGEAPYKVSVHDGDGNLVDSYETQSRAANDPWASANEELRNLYVAVRRQALNVDAVLETLMTGLPEDPEVRRQSNPWATSTSDEPPF